MPFWLYITICYVTAPARYLLNLVPFYRYSPVAYAIRLLFKNDYQVAFITAQAILESNDGESNLAKNYNNYFGMGNLHRSKYQSGSYNGGKAGEPVFAIYKNAYYSVYDLYDYYYNRVPDVGQALDLPRAEDFSVSSDANVSYIKWVCGRLGARHYFTSNAEQYARNIAAIEDRTPDGRYRFILANVFTLVLVGFAYYLTRLFSFSSKKRKAARSNSKDVRKGWQGLRRPFAMRINHASYAYRQGRRGVK
jgi:hypothetical protein